MSTLIPSSYMYESLPSDSATRTLCESESFVVADRPIDWRNKNYTTHFRSNLQHILTDKYEEK